MQAKSAEINKNGKAERQESNNEDSVKKGTDSAQSSARQTLAAIMPKNQFIPRCFTSFSLRVDMDMIMTESKFEDVIPSLIGNVEVAGIQSRCKPHYPVIPSPTKEEPSGELTGVVDAIEQRKA